MTTYKIQSTRVALQENINLYSEQWANDPDLFEDYVKSTYYDTEEGNLDISYPEFLYNALEVISKIDADFDFELQNEIRRFKNGQYEGAQNDRIEYEASDGKIYDIIYAENPNYEEETEAGIESSPMLWAIAGITADGLHWERDDFEYLFEAIDDLEVTLQG